MNVIFACGGTGGHIFPAVAIAEELMMRKKAKILFIGSDDGMEKEIVRKLNFDFAAISAKPLIRRITFRNFLNFFLIIKAIKESMDIIGYFKPDVVIGTGGFVSFPMITAAVMVRKRTLIHEPNVYPGIANRILGLFVDCITTGYEETKKYFPGGKTFVTGNPVRKFVLRKDRIKAIRFFGLNRKRKTILIMPGSRAAKKINDTVAVSLKKIEQEFGDIQIIWMTGKNDYKRIKDSIKKSKLKIKVFDFIYDVSLAYAAADIAILRAGASTLAEITAALIPAILVPYPYATDNHQEKNAMLFQKNNAAVVIKDNEFDTERLIKELKFLLNKTNNKKIKSNIRSLYKGNSAKQIVDYAIGV